MPTEQEYKEALLAIDPYFVTIKRVMDERIKELCIHADTYETMAALQAQYKLLSQLETEITNTKEGTV